MQVAYAKSRIQTRTCKLAYRVAHFLAISSFEQDILDGLNMQLAREPVLGVLRSTRQRVVVHVDCDAFYTQVEAKRNPALRDRAIAVVQYNPFGDLKDYGPDDPARIVNGSNGSLIAVSYAARAFGVKRNMRGDQARSLCPDLQLVQVPTHLGKADLTIYREARLCPARRLGEVGLADGAENCRRGPTWSRSFPDRAPARGHRSMRRTWT